MNPSDTSALPLAGLTVLDLTVARAGPTCVRHLADWGADVIRIQRPADGREELAGSPDGPDYQNLHRNKRVISLNLKSAEGREALLRLVRKADVLVENMRPPVKHQLKIAWEDLEPVNPRLVYGSLSGFGQSGPYAKRAGVDQVAQGMGGLMSVTGLPGQGPVRAGIAVADLTAGNLLALAIMMALYARQNTGRGQWVHTSLLESMIFMLDFQAARWLMKGEIPAQVGNEHPTAVPTGVFPTSDGFVTIGASSSKQWEALCAALERQEWLDVPEWKTQAGRSAARKAVHDAIGDVTQGKSSQHWAETLEAHGVPCGSINRVDQVFADPQVKHLGMAAAIDHPTLGRAALVGSPLHFDGLPRGIRHTAPLTCVHTEEVLRGVGYTADEIAAMRMRGAI